MISFRPDIPPHVAVVIRTLHPDLKQLIKSAIRTIVAHPECGETLNRELDGLHEHRIRPFRIIYAAYHKGRVIRLMAVGHRRFAYRRSDRATSPEDLSVVNARLTPSPSHL